MRAPSSLRHEFLKRWLKGLQIYSTTKKEMSVLDRKKAIKLSADVAIASTRVATTCWSRAIMAKASKDATDKVLVEHILGSDSDQRLKKAPMTSMANCRNRIRSKKILRKSYTARRLRKAATNVVQASSIAKKLVKKRTQVLKNLVPGGESMDEVSLIRETLDYIASLRLQVDVMRRLANVTMPLECSQDQE